MSEMDAVERADRRHAALKPRTPIREPANEPHRHLRRHCQTRHIASKGYFTATARGAPRAAPQAKKSPMSLSQDLRSGEGRFSSMSRSSRSSSFWRLSGFCGVHTST